MPTMQSGVDPGAQPLPPSPGGSARLGPAGRGRVDGAPVLLRPHRLQHLHVRRAGPGVDRRDLDDVGAGLTLDYNSGAVEGTVNRVKQLKAAMHGRAAPDLLRKPILLS